MPFASGLVLHLPIPHRAQVPALRRTGRLTARSETGLDDVGDGTSGEDVGLERFKAVKTRTLALIADHLCRRTHNQQGNPGVKNGKVNVRQKGARTYEEGWRIVSAM
jgi:hypothetical protein